MSAYTGTFRSVPLGVNRGNLIVAEYIVGSAATSSDTITITAPDGVDQGVPTAAVAYTPSTTSTNTVKAVTLTSFNPVTKVTVITPGAVGVAAGDVIRAMFT